MTFGGCLVASVHLLRLDQGGSRSQSQLGGETEWSLGSRPGPRPQASSTLMGRPCRPEMRAASTSAALPAAHQLSKTISRICTDEVCGKRVQAKAGTDMTEELARPSAASRRPARRSEDRREGRLGLGATDKSRQRDELEQVESGNTTSSGAASSAEWEEIASWRRRTRSSWTWPERTIAGVGEEQESLKLAPF